MLAHTNYIHSGLVEGSGVDSIYIDYAKAFDKVDHKVLLQKLKHYSVNDHYIEWIKSFLEGRFQTVNVDGFHSFPTPVLSGVPQGSVLGPLLFIIYLNDLSNEISGAEIQTFADDTKIVAKINTVDDKNNLQKNLDSVITWSQINNMKLNINKFELICHKSKTENKTLNLLNILPFSNSFNSYIATNSINIDPSSSVKDLGIVIDESLNWKLQIEVICKKSKQLSAWILSVFYTRDRLTMLTLFNALVRSRLEYCCEVWSPHQIQDIVKVEQLQRSFTHRISGMKDHNYWDRLEILKIMSLQRRREKIIIIHLWKILNKVNPNSLEIQFREHSRNSSIKAILKPLPKIRGAVLTNYENSFIIYSAKLWNILPPNLTVIKSLNLFKLKLDKFLSNLPDKPPLPGYPKNCDNSLVNLCV